MGVFFVIFSLCFLSSLGARQLEVEVSAPKAILINADTAAILFEKEAYTPAFPGSTTKIATTLYILENQEDLSRMATVSAESLKGRPLKDRDHLPAYWLDSDGTMMWLKRGEIVSYESLLHGLMLVSGNDAANVIAESFAGTVPQFMVDLNSYLAQLGCKNTQFRNPHGLHHPEHWSTAFDLSLMTRRALEIEKFRKIVSTLTFTRPKTNKQPEGELKLTNPLLKPNSRYYYSKAIGVKTGYTDAARYTLVAAAEHEGRRLIAVVLGCNTREDRYKDVKRLFDAAFGEEKATRKLIGSDHTFTKEVEGAKGLLKAVLPKGLTVSYFPAEEPKCRALVNWTLPTLPIVKGQKVGEVHIHDEKDRLLQKGDLVASSEVKGTFLFMLKQKLLQIFR